MPAMSAPQKTSATTIQANLVAVKQALIALAQSSGDLATQAFAAGTTEAAIAGNHLMILQGVAIELRGRMIQAHGDASLALLAYDAATGVPMTQGGGGR